MKKVSSPSINFLNERKWLKEGKPKFKKLISQSTMTDPSSMPGLDQELKMHHMPIKSEFPSTSEYITGDEYHQQLYSSSKKVLRKSKMEYPQKTIKVEKDSKEGILKIGKKRGRPSKSRMLNLGQIVCHLCYYKAQSLYELEMHMKTHQNMYDCSYCNASFSQKGNLMTHIRTHTKEKPFKCPLCSFAASQKVNLQVHLRIHTKEKPFKCSLCDFSTAQKCNLMAHISRKHSNIEVVKTLDNYDSKVACSESQLKYYRCSVCMYSCKLKKDVLEHVKTQHPFAVCDIKPFVF